MAGTREAVGVFHDERSLQAAVDELLISGFDRAFVSLVADRRSVEQRLGRSQRKVDELEDDPETPMRAFAGIDSRTEAKAAIVGVLAYIGAAVAIAMVAASGGTEATAFGAAVAAGGAGALLGLVASGLIDRSHGRYLQQQLDRGGLLLWVRTPDAEHEKRAIDILGRWAADHVHIHDLPELRQRFTGGVSYDVSFMKRLGL